MLQGPQGAAAVVQSDPMREVRPRKRGDLQDIVQELDDLESTRPYLFHRGGLLDRIEIVAHVVNAAAGRCDDIIESGEITHKQGLGVGALGVEAAIGHRLTATGLVTRVNDLVAKSLQELQGCDTNLREKGIDVAGDEEPDAHLSLLQ